PRRQSPQRHGGRETEFAVIIIRLLLFGFAGLAFAAESRPNFLFILADDLGYGDVSINRPQGDVRTPNIDRLAAARSRFSTMRANCTVCSPTRAAIMTMRFPDRVGVPGLVRTNATETWGYLDPNVPTIAGLLHGAGYHTGIVGKWNLGLTSPNQPTERG